MQNGTILILIGLTKIVGGKDLFKYLRGEKVQKVNGLQEFRFKFRQ
jgi:hypothetical protein